MALFPRRGRGDTAAQIAWDSMGKIQSPIGFTSFPWQTHPNDRYRRVFPDGPYTMEWPGVQKINLITSVGTQRASMYGDEPAYLTQLRSRSGTVQSVNWAAYSQGAGPAVIQAQEEAMQQSQRGPSFWQSVLARVRG